VLTKEYGNNEEKTGSEARLLKKDVKILTKENGELEAGRNKALLRVQVCCKVVWCVAVCRGGLQRFAVGSVCV